MWLYNDSIYPNLEKNAVFVGDELEVSVFGWKMIGPVALFRAYKAESTHS